MNLLQAIIGAIFSLIVCFGIPLGYLIYIIVAKKKYVKAYFIGMLAFFISQICLRIPILKALYKTAWFTEMVTFYPVLYAIIIAGLSAGIFEEGARFLGFKVGLKKERSWEQGIAFGIGHGGIEAMLIVGIAKVNELLMLISLSNGTFDGSKFGVTEEMIRASLQGVNMMIAVMPGVERIFAMMLHVGLTLVVLYGINKGKKLYLLVAILIHTATNAGGVILMQNNLSLYVNILWLIICALSLSIFSIKSNKLFREGKGNEKVI